MTLTRARPGATKEPGAALLAKFRVTSLTATRTPGIGVLTMTSGLRASASRPVIARLSSTSSQVQPAGPGSLAEQGAALANLKVTATRRQHATEPGPVQLEPWSSTSQVRVTDAEHATWCNPGQGEQHQLQSSKSKIQHWQFSKTLTTFWNVTGST